MVLLRTTNRQRKRTGCIDRRRKQSAEQIQQGGGGKENHSHNPQGEGVGIMQTELSYFEEDHILEEGLEKCRKQK